MSPFQSGPRCSKKSLHFISLAPQVSRAKARRLEDLGGAPAPLALHDTFVVPFVHVDCDTSAVAAYAAGTSLATLLSSCRETEETRTLVERVLQVCVCMAMCVWLCKAGCVCMCMAVCVCVCGV